MLAKLLFWFFLFLKNYSSNDFDCGTVPKNESIRVEIKYLAYVLFYIAKHLLKNIKILIESSLVLTLNQLFALLKHNDHCTYPHASVDVTPISMETGM